MTVDKATLRQVVDTIYDEGRSQIAHGGKLALLRELPADCGLADSFVRQILAAYIVCASFHRGDDTYEAFLKALPALRAAAVAAANT